MNAYQALEHQRKLLFVTLWLVITLSLVIGSINVVSFQANTIASFNFTSAVLGLVILLYFKRTQNLNVASWSVILAVIFNLFMFIFIAKGQAYSLIWFTVLAPLSFFLLGKTAASWVSAIAFVLALIYVGFSLPNSNPHPLKVGALLNVAEVFVVLWFLFRYYERARQDAYQALEKVSITDRLTGLHNRGRLEDLLDYHLQLAKRDSSPLSIVLADIDYFKNVNDEFGHLEGDRVLKQAAKDLRSGIRETDIIGRWGGEEFLLVCPDTASTGAATLAEKLRDQVAKRVQTLDGKSVTLSFGVVTAHPNDTPTQLISRADKALYQAKERGRNLVITN
ncbi:MULTISPECIES: GGDEF domain-containing protein [Gammaproteobacteria]|uniref:GGDEF domain-containing protein n=1 Tax=Gammaproteobacteria TaxID=1236 RepID=UPI000DD0D482|nr:MULTISPECIES: GGDEF domain-containing protein [Gammaproteobacteria]RTE86400.1 diguanylate cyclase [Aliidiomarina sp. B3213]TCZ91747.1 diguanylate cyclase [Lysobacter sp. N42]